MRTTSSLESMNAVLKRICPVHPHLFKFLDRLRFHEFSKSFEMLQAINSDSPTEKLERRRRLKCRQRMAKIKYLTKELKENKEMTAGLFLDAMANGDTLTEIGKIILNMRFVESLNWGIKSMQQCHLML